MIPKTNNIPTIVLVYDSITNPVFESQVVRPLSKRIGNNGSAHIISFERKPQACAARSAHIGSTYPTISITLKKKGRFWGIRSLNPLVHNTRSLLPLTPHQLITRGPFAGYIGHHARNEHTKKHIVQVRGLAAQEYAYTQRSASLVKRPLVRLRTRQFETLETVVYQLPNTTFEIVSSALANYLHTTYKTPAEHCITAAYDLPEIIPAGQKQQWRRNVRAGLSISKTATVYCYNGSAQPWQCPEQVIAYFVSQHTHDPCAILLIISQDLEYFARRLHTLSPDSYRLISTDHTTVARYLAAADIGIIMREKHLINWVSRPTKILEYQAAGLSIAHNHTIGMMIPSS